MFENASNILLCYFLLHLFIHFPGNGLRLHNFQLFYIKYVYCNYHIKCFSLILCKHRGILDECYQQSMNLYNYVVSMLAHLRRTRRMSRLGALLFELQRSTAPAPPALELDGFSALKINYSVVMLHYLIAS